jgi:hypothetical protein
LLLKQRVVIFLSVRGGAVRSNVYITYLFTYFFSC